MPASTFASMRWYADRVRYFTDVAPAQAFRVAAVASAGTSAKVIRSGYSGALARDISNVRFTGPIAGRYGSSKPYALAEDEGAVIHARGGGRMLIRGRRVGAAGQVTRSTVGGEIVASATEVRHQGKGWRRAGQALFRPLFVQTLARLLPGGR